MPNYFKSWLTRLKIALKISEIHPDSAGVDIACKKDCFCQLENSVCKTVWVLRLAQGPDKSAFITVLLYQKNDATLFSVRRREN